MARTGERYRAAERDMFASVGLAPVEHRVALERIGATVRVNEVGSGPPVVFVHGASNTGVSWATLAARLPGFRCLLLDRPGCGFSDPLPRPLHDVEALTRFGDGLVVDVLDAMGIDAAFVVSTSLGGYTGVRSAAAHPDRVRGLVEFSWNVGAPAAKTPLSMRITAIPGLNRLAGIVPPNDRMVKTILKQVGLRNAIESGTMSQQMIDTFRLLMTDTHTMRNELAAGPRIVTPITGFNDSVLIPDTVLASIRVPVLFLWGEDDPQGGAAVARPYVAKIPGAQLELLPGAGHAPWLDDLDRCAERVAAFLAQEG